MKKFNTMVLGCSGLIGVTLTGLLNKNKTLFVAYENISIVFGYTTGI